jgi:hypothetical protein
MANTKQFFRLKTYTNTKIDVKLLKIYKMLVIDRHHQVVCLYFVPEWQGISSGHRFNDIFDVHIEEGPADWRILVNSILQAEVQILHS